MPWRVSSSNMGCPKDKPFAVVKSDTNELVSCHATKSQAEAHVRALYTNVPDAKRTTPGKKIY